MQRELGRRSFFAAHAPVADRAQLRAFAMAAALLGVPLAEQNDFILTRRVEAGKSVELVSWYLATKSADGRFKTAQLWAWWNDPEWLAANPTHPLAIYREFADALRDAAAHEAATPAIAVLTRGARRAFIPVNLPADRKKKLLELFETS